MVTRRFPRGAVASPHHLASAVGQHTLADGGNAVDAAVATGLALAVLTPYHCGLGGDVLAQVWDGRATGVLSAGAAPTGATPAAIRGAVATSGAPAPHRGADGMPQRGPLTVTVPGAVAGWFHLLERWGSRSFGTLAGPASRLARDGFPVSSHGATLARNGLAAHGDDSPLARAFADLCTAGRRVRQPELAATLDRLAEAGPHAYYRGELAERIVGTLARGGATMTTDDLAAHTVEEAAPLATSFRGIEVLELPPPTQGVTALTALGVLEALGTPPRERAAALHLEVEAVRAAMADRAEHLGDPVGMRAEAGDLLAPRRLRRIASRIDPDRAAAWPAPRPVPGGTAYLCAVDADGMAVSLSQSNYRGFGSGVVVEGAGFALHNRGAHFTLDDGPGVIAPGRRPLHTLIPAMTLADGEPRLVFGTMGGDAQPQIHLQLLSRLLGQGADLQEALDAPRFVVDAADGSVSLEGHAARALVEGLRSRGHHVRGLEATAAGHAHALALGPTGIAGATDRRTEGAVVGS